MPKKKRVVEKRPRGRPKVAIDIEQLTALARIGASQEEAASVLKCGVRTLKERLAGEPALKAAWDDGVLQGKLSLRRLQWRHANGTGSSAVNMTIHLSKHRLGETDKAAIELSGKDGNPLQVVLSRDDTGLL